jgi:hypothetical protein
MILAQSDRSVMLETEVLVGIERPGILVKGFDVLPKISS